MEKNSNFYEKLYQKLDILDNFNFSKCSSSTTTSSTKQITNLNF